MNKAEKKEYNRKHYLENRKHYLEYSRKYRLKHRQHYLKYLRKYYLNNKEKHSEYYREYNKKLHPYKRLYDGMKTRCLNPRNKDFKNYGARGIKICKRWLNSFENFFKDMGERPSPVHTLDRINNDRDYKPSNCRWATWHEQAQNRRKRFSKLKEKHHGSKKAA